MKSNGYLDWLTIYIPVIAIALGFVLHYIPDHSVAYAKPTEINTYLLVDESFEGQPSYHVKMPWWRIDLSDGDIIRIDIPEKDQGSNWDFVEVFGHEQSPAANGHLILNEGPAIAIKGALPSWQYFGEPTQAGVAEIRYRAADPNAVFTLWGSYLGGQGKTSSSYVVRGGAPLDMSQEIYPHPHWGKMPFINMDDGISFVNSWRHAKNVLPKDPWVRIGDEISLASTTTIGLFLFLGGLLVLAGRFFFDFVRFTLTQPKVGLALVVVIMATFAIRLDVLYRFIDAKSFEIFSTTITHGVWWDSAGYFQYAINIFSNQIPDRYYYSIGMPNLVATLWEFTGVGLMPVKVLFVSLQTAVGGIIYWTAYRVSNRPWLSFLPMIAWAVMPRPMKYDYYFLTESTAIFIAGGILFSFFITRQRNDPRWAPVIMAGVIYGLAVLSRDIFIIFAPFVLLGVLFIFGRGLIQKLLRVAAFTIVVGALWMPITDSHVNKQGSGGLVSYLPIMDQHVNRSLSSVGIGKGDTQGNIILRVSRRVLNDFLDNPAGYTYDKAKNSFLFWAAPWEYEDGAKARSHWLTSNYEIIPVLIFLLTASSLFYVNRRSVPLIVTLALLTYITAFHVFLYTGFSARPKAVYYPIVVLCGYFGLLVLLDRFGRQRSKAPSD